MAAGIDLALGFTFHLAGRSDLVAIDGNVAFKRGFTGSVDDRAVADDEVVHAGGLVGKIGAIEVSFEY